VGLMLGAAAIASASRKWKISHSRLRHENSLTDSIASMLDPKTMPAMSALRFEGRKRIVRLWFDFSNSVMDCYCHATPHTRINNYRPTASFF
jgi:hypothetical protein